MITSCMAKTGTYLLLYKRRPGQKGLTFLACAPARDFCERAFKRAGLPIHWEGKPGLTETGVVSEGELAGKIVVRVNAKYFRPAEVLSHAHLHYIFSCTMGRYLASRETCEKMFALQSS